MAIKNFLLTTATAATMLGITAKCADDVATSTNQDTELKTERVDNLGNLKLETPAITEEKVVKDLSICLELDKNSHTHTSVLESITDPENTVLEFPVDQLFDKYGNRNHPLAVSGVSRNFRALLGKGGIEESTIPQKLKNRSEGITSETKYEVGDTIRFALINPALKGEFPQNLADQLKEDGFQTFSDTDLLLNKIENIGFNNENIEKSDFVYDIVVKKLSSGKSALALYKDGELFMTTYVSVGLNNRRTKTGQFKVLNKNPYYYSRKYKSPMPDGLQFDEGGFWFHQGNVTGYPASHGCVRLPGLYAAAMYSLTKTRPNIDVFISKNLYNHNK